MLTKKELRVMELRKEGLKQMEIASKLKISQPAVSAFENNAIRKINDAKRIIEFVKKIRYRYEEAQ